METRIGNRLTTKRLIDHPWPKVQELSSFECIRGNVGKICVSVLKPRSTTCSQGSLSKNNMNMITYFIGQATISKSLKVIGTKSLKIGRMLIHNMATISANISNIDRCTSKNIRPMIDRF